MNSYPVVTISYPDTEIIVDRASGAYVVRQPGSTDLVYVLDCEHPDGYEAAGYLQSYPIGASGLVYVWVDAPREEYGETSGEVESAGTSLVEAVMAYWDR